MSEEYMGEILRALKQERDTANMFAESALANVDDLKKSNDQLRADLSRVTNDWHRLGKLCEEYEHAQVGLKRDLARVTAERTQEYNELREACAKRENALRAELEKVTAERDQLQSIAEKRYEEFRREANAHFVAAGEIEKLEARCGELVAALRNIVEWADPFYAHEVRDFGSARALLDRAESAAPAKEEQTYYVPHARTIAQPAKPKGGA